MLAVWWVVVASTVAFAIVFSDILWPALFMVGLIRLYPVAKNYDAMARR